MTTRSILSRLVRRARDERGYALVLAIGLLTVFAITGTTAAVYASGAVRTSARSNEEQSAYALAEAGLNEAQAMVWKVGDNATSQASVPIPASIPGSPQRTVGAGQEYFWGVYNSPTLTWTLYGRGVVPNTSAPGTTITRTVSTKLWFPAPSPHPDTSAWDGLYAASTTGCLSLTNGIQIQVPIYSRGNLCIDGGAVITSPDIQARGSISIDGGSYVGSAAKPVARISATGTISVTGGSHLYAQTQDHTPDDVTKPPLQLSNWYANADLGPNSPCTIVSGTTGLPGGGTKFDTNTSNDWNQPAWNITPGGNSYSCIKRNTSGAITGQLIWSGGWNGGTLQIAGTIFYDGPIFMNGGVDVVYRGRATIYASKFDIGNGATMCGITGCDDPAIAKNWDTNSNMLVLVSGQANASPYGFNLTGGSIVQAAIYCAGNAYLSNGTTNWGPLIAEQITFAGGAVQPAGLSTMPTGAPTTYVTDPAKLQPLAGSYSTG